MKIESRNDGAARKVLAEVKRWAALSSEDCIMCVEAYVNCREQGFALASCDDRKVAFSEFRRSDDIVVYFGKRKDFAFNTNIPSEEVYESARFFRYNQQEAAAKFIVKYLES
jgi:hypothetical protein